MKIEVEEKQNLINAAINIRIVETVEEFETLKENWNRLSVGLAPINNFEWQYKWWKQYKDNNELKILVAEKENKVVGIAPVFIENAKALKYINFKKLCFLGGDISDYLDFLIEQNEDREEIFASLFNFILNNLSYDYLELRFINTEYPNFDLWQKYIQKNGFELTFSKECPALKLADYNSYNEYFKNISKSLKRNLKTRQNKLQKDGLEMEVEYKDFISEEDINLIGDINLNRQIYKVNKGELKRFCYFSDQKKLNFIKDYFCSDPNNSKMLAYLKLNGVVVSYILALLNDTTLFYWNTAVNPEYLTYGPSKFLINELIKFSYEKKLICFDFMRGVSSYKLEWSNSQSVNYHLFVKMSYKAKMIYCYRDNLSKFIKRSYSFNMSE